MADKNKTALHFFSSAFMPRQTMLRACSVFDDSAQKNKNEKQAWEAGSRAVTLICGSRVSRHATDGQRNRQCTADDAMPARCQHAAQY
jgi:hypothetical protein